jgi:CheY-like chemotaxis protein
MERTEPSARPHRILVVEDDPDIREKLLELLRDGGYEVRAASHGRDALDVLDGWQRPCLILIDLMMPVMSGAELLMELGDGARWSGIPHIVMTAARAPCRTRSAVATRSSRPSVRRASPASAG